MRAVLLFLVLVLVFSLTLVVAWPHCVHPDCANAFDRSRRWLAGVVAGGAVVSSWMLWRMYRREQPHD